jgi:hypothetical protein
VLIFAAVRGQLVESSIDEDSLSVVIKNRQACWQHFCKAIEERVLIK